MSKRMKSVSFSCSSESIGSILEQLNSIKKEHPEVDIMDARLNTKNDYGDSYSVFCTYERYETDKERSDRETREQEFLKQREDWDRKQFEALKKKFGD